MPITPGSYNLSEALLMPGLSPQLFLWALSSYLVEEAGDCTEVHLNLLWALFWTILLHCLRPYFLQGSSSTLMGTVGVHPRTLCARVPQRPPCWSLLLHRLLSASAVSLPATGLLASSRSHCAITVVPCVPGGGQRCGDPQLLPCNIERENCQFSMLIHAKTGLQFRLGQSHR